MFDSKVISDIREHAISQYPNEMCGLVMEEGFMPIPNTHEDPLNFFRIDEKHWLNGDIARSLAIVHSHTNGKNEPTGKDIQGQISSGKMWGLITTCGERCSAPIWWGPGVPLPPLIGRDFRNGPSGSDGKGDCYALIKDWFKINHDIELTELPRDNLWWMRDGENLYLDNFQKFGFKVVNKPEPGDCFIAQVLGKVPSHAGVLIDHNTILHHLSGRLSRRDPVLPWRKYVHHWVRYCK